MRLPVGVLLLLALSGCVGHTSQHAVELARTEHYRLLRIEAPTGLRQIAADTLGEAAFASAIARANGMSVDASLVRSDHVVVPIRPVNRSYVHAHGVLKVQILCYHRFSEQASSDPMVVSRADFEAQMNYLAENDFHVISLAAFDRLRAEGGLFADRTVVITIDDGYASAADVALPVLERFGFPATLFIYPEFIGGGHALTWSQLRDISRNALFDVQSHATSHTSLLPQPAEQALKYLERIEQEVVTADRTIRRRLGIKPVYLAYPYGDVSRPLLELMEKHGYRLALTVQRGGVALFDDPHLLRRTMVYGHDDLADFAAKLETLQPLAGR